MSESINKLKELALLLQDPNCDVNVVTLRIADLLDTLPKLLAVVETARQAALDCEDAGCELIADKLYTALAALEEEV